MVKKIDKKAFTLIEVLVVIAIVGILTLLAVPRIIGHAQKAEEARIQNDVKMMEQEIGAKLVNKDDEFNKWKSSRKDLNKLAENKELFENKGVVKKVEPIDETYKVIPKEYKAKINTKLEGTFYANSAGKVYYEHGEMPEYSAEKINDLIKQGYIPIATAEELNNVRRATLETYGVGTDWEGKYLGGLDKKYVQVKDIDLSVYSGVEGWAPIGTFTGTYDGGNYVITGLDIKGDGKNYQGLFGYTSGATISNVALEDINVTGARYVGGLVGQASSSTVISNSYAEGLVKGSSRVGGLVGRASSGNISNSYTTGTVTGRSQIGGLVGEAAYSSKISSSYAIGEVTGSATDTELYVGGLVGWVEESTIENSYATGPVTGRQHVGGLVGGTYKSTTISSSYATGSATGTYQVGGLVGSASKSTIKNSYAIGPVEGTGESVGGLVGSDYMTNISNSYATGSVTGSVKGDASVGGLVGWASSGKISNSYATGKVTGKDKVGGLVGWAYNSSIENSYTAGQVTGTGSEVGGLIGMDYRNINIISNSYWNKDTTPQEGSALGEGKTTEDMKNQATYPGGDSGWNFDTVWEINEGEYPRLR